MILPILSYGHSILQKKAAEVKPGYPGLKKIISDMWETMYAANGAGLASPQIGKSIRLFVVDTIQVFKHSSRSEREWFIGDNGIKEVFINPQIIETTGNKWTETEGCLSFPGMPLEIERQFSLFIKYFDEDFKEKNLLFNGATARAIKHEYDHLEGILFTEYVDNKEIKEALEKISHGDVKVNYRMKFSKKDK